MKSFKKPKLEVIVKEGEKHLWSKFAVHHYMDHNLPASSVFYTFYWIKDEQEILVGCCGVLFQIARNLKARRFTRVVVLPEYQGLGFGSKIINTIAAYYKHEGIQKFFLSTFHPRLGEYMRHSDKWEASNNNLKEFKTNEKATEGAMKGLRDGVAMYRYSFVGCEKYSLRYNPIHILRIKTELKSMDKSTDEYKKLSEELRLISPEKITKQLEYMDPKLLLSEEEQAKAKASHKRLFKPKRKVLTSEERKAAKMKLKSKKEGFSDDEW
jgi:GNAT superfamily N-acetyltransferase